MEYESSYGSTFRVSDYFILPEDLAAPLQQGDKDLPQKTTIPELQYSVTEQHQNELDAPSRAYVSMSELEMPFQHLEFM